MVGLGAGAGALGVLAVLRRRVTHTLVHHSCSVRALQLFCTLLVCPALGCRLPARCSLVGVVGGRREGDGEVAGQHLKQLLARLLRKCEKIATEEFE